MLGERAALLENLQKALRAPAAALAAIVAPDIFVAGGELTVLSSRLVAGRGGGDGSPVVEEPLAALHRRYRGAGADQLPCLAPVWPSGPSHLASRPVPPWRCRRGSSAGQPLAHRHAEGEQAQVVVGFAAEFGDEAEQPIADQEGGGDQIRGAWPGREPPQIRNRLTPSSANWYSWEGWRAGRPIAGRSSPRARR